MNKVHSQMTYCSFAAETSHVVELYNYNKEPEVYIQNPDGNFLLADSRGKIDDSQSLWKATKIIQSFIAKGRNFGSLEIKVTWIKNIQHIS